jgi:hypothetical protein
VFDTDRVETAVMRVRAGQRPPRPICLNDQMMPLEFFDLITDCWNHTPEERPTMKEVLGYFAVEPEDVYVGQPLFVAQVEVASPAAAGMQLIQHHKRIGTDLSSTIPSSHRDGQVDPGDWRLDRDRRVWPFAQVVWKNF